LLQKLLQFEQIYCCERMQQVRCLLQRARFLLERLLELTKLLRLLRASCLLLL
jgi:hypothetical protein